MKLPVVTSLMVAAAAGFGLTLTSSSAQSAQSTHSYKFPVTAMYQFKSPTAPASTYRGSNGYLKIAMRPNPNTTPMDVYLCSSGATADDCAKGVSYSRDQLLAYQAMFQTAIYFSRGMNPILDTDYPCNKVGTYYCPVAFVVSEAY